MIWSDYPFINISVRLIKCGSGAESMAAPVAGKRDNIKAL